MTQAPQLAAGVTLRTLSLSMRVLLTCFLVTVGIGFLSAILYLFLQDIDPHRRMGMAAVPAVAVKYYGARNTTRLESALRGSMSSLVSAAETEQLVAWIRSGARESGFPAVKPILDRACVDCHNLEAGPSVAPLTDYAQVRALAEVDTGYSLLQLARVSHVHLFGNSILFLLTGAVVALSEISWKWRLPIVVSPYLAMWGDIGSWWITKYDPAFAAVVVAAGTLIGLSLAAQIFVALWEMWIAPRRHIPTT